MLKRSKKILLLVLGVLLLGGCKAKFETNMSINEDKSMNLKIIEGFDDELINAMMSMNESSSLEEIEEVKEYTDEEQRKFLQENLFKSDEAFASVEEEGFVVEEYQDNTYMGYMVIKNIENIDNYVGDNTNFSLSSYEDFNSKKIFTKYGNVYKGRILFENAENEEAAETYDIDFEYVFTLTLPNKVISSNATTVSEDGKTLTWNLVNSNIYAIEFEFEFPSFLTMIKDNMFIVAGIAIVIILIIVVLITLIINKFKKNHKDVKNGNSVMNEQDSVMSPQPKIQPIISQDSVVSLQPEIQSVMPQDSVVNPQPEIQAVMPQYSVVSPQPEIQPIMSQEPLVNIQPEPQKPIVIPDIEVQPVVSEQPINSEPLFPQDVVPPKDYK